MCEVKEIVKDFQDLGLIDKTYNDVMITDVLEAINISGHFTAEIDSKREITFSDENHRDGSITIDIGYEGGYAGEFDQASIWEDLVAEIGKEEYNHEKYDIDHELDTLYSLKQIKIAFDIVSWEDHAQTTVGCDEIHEACEYSFSTSEINESKVNIEATITIDVDKITIDENLVIDDLLNCL